MIDVSVGRQVALFCDAVQDREGGDLLYKGCGFCDAIYEREGICVGCVASVMFLR